MTDQPDDDIVRARVDRFRSALVELGMQLDNFRAAGAGVAASHRALSVGPLATPTAVPELAPPERRLKRLRPPRAKTRR